MADFEAKRFWKETTVAPVEGGFTVLLDGRNVRTPAKALLVVPTQDLAEHIRIEWDAQEGKIDPNSMPFTRGANAAIDKVRIQHAEVADMLSEYGDSDLVCYRASYPRELVAMQAEAWDPIIAWVKDRFGAALQTREGVMPVPQDQASLDLLRQHVHGFTEFELSAFHDLVALTGSLALGLAATESIYSEKDLWDRSRIDETFQISQWGADDDATSIAEIKRDSFFHAYRFFHMAQK
ncbi:chaperone required for assembly of F1-ATPase [Pacificibacter maritimus]|uniref:Chaperone required for assembly of F1-ATPase n=1 Tax=Pacificibacter maritimus TaxID=762213 RepID=A0A3N4TXR5_9RHOB|nr:ATP12 family protein [Pacificibacter maritimus]RPE63306.1 chaperone required for assembly of F1-ATPase [Pacificibacter maritimus]